jgi:type IV secretory pathway VirB2 component (pilin)
LFESKATTPPRVSGSHRWKWNNGNQFLDLSSNHEEEVREMKAFEKIRSRWIKLAAGISYAFGIVTIVLPARAFAAAAAGGALPWDQPLTTLQTDLQGPVAHSITTAAVIGAGLTWAFSEHGTGARKVSALAFGGAAALGATQLMTAVFPFAGALF